MNDLTALTIHEAHGLLTQKKISSLELTQAHLARIALVDCLCQRSAGAARYVDEAAWRCAAGVQQRGGRRAPRQARGVLVIA